MSKIGEEYLALTSEDMGDPSVYPDDYLTDKAVEESFRAYELSRYSTEELQAELERRGYVNGVLVHPEKDEA